MMVMGPMVFLAMSTEHVGAGLILMEKSVISAGKVFIIFPVVKVS